MSLCEEEYTLLKNEYDWKWYKKKIDFDQKHEHEHVGPEVPEEFPCLVNSYISEYGKKNGSDQCRHTFLYKEENKCEKCGHGNSSWPTVTIVKG